MLGMTIRSAAESCGGRVVPADTIDKPIGSVVIDSRAIAPGDLFVAYKGEHADGHDYIKTALTKGAACALAERVPEDVTGPVILVDSVQLALERITARCRRNLTLPIVGVTGSVGKTSAKEMIWSVLSRTMSVHKTDKNLNNQIGVPMTVSRVNEWHDAAVIEMGISNFGDMAALAPMVLPHIMVYTVIGHAHLEFLGDLEGVLRAKTELLPLISPDTLLVLNGDDEYLRKIASPHRKVYYGLGEHNDIRAENIRPGRDEGTACTIVCPGGRMEVSIPAFGQHMVYAALSAAAVGLEMGLSEAEIRAGIAAYHTVGRRGAISRNGGITLVDDCYNANPDSVKSGIDSLMTLPGRHVCILGDMLELGGDSPQMHADCGSYAGEKGVELVVACGELSRCTAQAAGERALFFESREQLIKALPQLIRRGDAVLVKASRASKFEEVSEAIKELEL